MENPQYSTIWRKTILPALSRQMMWQNKSWNTKQKYFVKLRICGQKIDAEKLAQIVFSDSSKRELLNSITHPGTIKAINQRIAGSKAELTVVEAALLLGTGIEHQCDELWDIYCNEATRIRRLMENRNYSMEKAKNIIKSQPSDEDYRKACTNMIDNSGSIEDMKEQIDRLLCILPCGF